MKLGKLAHRSDPRTFRLARYLTRLPKPPSALNVAVAVPSWPMYANDRLGDCTCAAAGHMTQVWRPTAPPPAETDVVAMYEAITGGVDEGAVMLDVLNYWRKNATLGDSPQAFALLEHGSQLHYRIALRLFEGVYLGLALPLSAQDEVGATWRSHTGTGGEPGSWGGHAVNVVGYNRHGVTLITWGRTQQATWAFLRRYADEAWAVIPQAWTPPAGFDDAALHADLAALGTVR